MSTDLIELAKKCGACVQLPNWASDLTSMHFTPAELEAFASALSEQEGKPSDERAAFEAWRESVLHIPRSISPLKAWFARAALAATPEPTQARASDELPMLPKAAYSLDLNDGFPTVAYSAQQMYDFARSAQGARASDAEDAWQPIETAPEEGEFLVYMPGERSMKVQAAKWHPNCKIIGGVFAFDRKPATHWRPLPATPASKEAK